VLPVKALASVVLTVLLLVGAAPALTEAALTITPDTGKEPKVYDFSDLAPKPPSLTYTPVEEGGLQWKDVEPQPGAAAAAAQPAFDACSTSEGIVWDMTWLESLSCLARDVASAVTRPVVLFSGLAALAIAVAMAIWPRIEELVNEWWALLPAACLGWVAVWKYPSHLGEIPVWVAAVFVGGFLVMGLYMVPMLLAVAVMLWVIRRSVEWRRARKLEAGPLGGSMKTPLKITSAAVLLLVLLFAGPVVYRTGQRIALWLNCSSDYSDNCWAASGLAIMHGGKLPRR
jgi:hypothetical protein